MIRVEEGRIYFRGCFRQSDCGYEILARVIPQNGTQTIKGTSLRIENSGAVLVFLKIQPRTPEDKLQEQEMKANLAALPADFGPPLPACRKPR